MGKLRSFNITSNAAIIPEQSVFLVMNFSCVSICSWEILTNASEADMWLYFPAGLQINTKDSLTAQWEGTGRVCQIFTTKGVNDESTLAVCAVSTIIITDLKIDLGVLKAHVFYQQIPR